MSLDLSDRVLRRIYSHAYAYPEAEVGGVLVGSLPDDGGGATTVLGALPAYDARGDLTSLTFTHDSWADVHRMKEVQYPDAAIVGWYHTHPGHGIFLSEHDLFVHRNFFPMQESLAFVVDPVRHEEGLFVMRGDAMQEVFIRPADTPEATVHRRRESQRAKTQQQHAKAQQQRAKRTQEPRVKANTKATTPPKPTAANAGPRALDVVLTDIGITAAALAAGLVVAKGLW